MVTIVMEVEDRFGVSISDEVVSDCVTVSDLQRVIVELLVEKGRRRSSQLEADVYADLVKIIVDGMGMDPNEVRPESRWVGDITKCG